jgi:hypothetical protein
MPDIINGSAKLSYGFSRWERYDDALHETALPIRAIGSCEGIAQDDLFD